MVKTQVQIPERLYREAKRIAEAKDAPDLVFLWHWFAERGETPG